jgi:hypothetical protein
MNFLEPSGRDKGSPTRADDGTAEHIKERRGELLMDLLEGESHGPLGDHDDAI